MRILVVGGTGFIGGPLARRLRQQDHRVVTFHRGDASERGETIRGDRRQLPAFRDRFARLEPDVAVDTIAYSEADAEGLVRAFRGLARRVVVLSSQDVYAAFGRLLGLESGAPEAVPLSEESALRASRYPYRARARPGEMAYDYDKIEVEKTVTGVAELPVTILRLPCVYGPGDPQRRLRPYLDRMSGGRAEVLLDRAKAAWRWTRGYVEDVADAIALATVDARAAGRVYNVGEERAHSEAAWVRAIGAAADWRGEVRGVPREELPEESREPYDFAHDLSADTSRIRRELGYRERVGTAEGLKHTVAWERDAG
jgi:nucleoside-diphosphate-sugar epimerase